MRLHPDRQKFRELAAEGNLVPVWTEILADQETPVSAYERVRSVLRSEDHASHTYLLESVEGGENIGRYSIIGGTPRAIIRAKGRRVAIEAQNEDDIVWENIDPLEAVKHYMSRFTPVSDPNLPRFAGGAVGFIGYDCVAQFEKLDTRTDNALRAPDLVFMVTDALIVFDRVRHTVKVVANAHIDSDPLAAYDSARATIEHLCQALTTPICSTLIDCETPTDEPAPRSNVTRSQFESAVERAREYVHAGDVVQTVLSQRFETDFEGDSLDVYRALRSINPSPYMFCLDLGESAMVGSSPEIHVRCEDGQVEVRPIAGTRPRGRNREEDKLMEEELLGDPKERAEHIMLVDLARNDIGRVCKYNTVTVPELMVIERYSHVMHIVSDVQGDLADGCDEYDVMRATFPAGTVSGAPKYRAMQIIAELERAKRGPYAGAVGYFNFNDNLDSCITIRTVILDNDKAYVQAGAGIVADSDPAKEYEETCNKARGMFKALALARRFTEARRREQQS